MIDHCSISVKDYDKSLKFYDHSLLALGYKRLITIDKDEMKYAAYGKDPKPSLWIGPMGREDEEIGRARGMHLAFTAPGVKSVHDWHARCLEYGGRDNGAPGTRPEYHPGYYGAFIIDPDGWRIEAAFHHYISSKAISKAE
ncbi:glyoxalase/Bleomycin resistance protein/Dioxygenase superfamily protein [Caedimonas varicaedens]|uniref:Glyoxalase/Bleomycin resistance protein/Dioxygenase superfamily protein n=1 Tax=Caedimonas varicaedens TaxID=1629334 RepID=A0A0K8MFF1_9PROT|nr:glyoxalase/Bleomycin resistance protein/Dioxygenase superfamily protein [Caedimonas varicaedens]